MKNLAAWRRGDGRRRARVGASPAGAARPAMVAPLAPPMAPRAQRTATRNEVVAKVRDHFARVDTNRDGFVTDAEMEARRGQNKLARQGGQRRRTAGQCATARGAIPQRRSTGSTPIATA